MKSSILTFGCLVVSLGCGTSCERQQSAQTETLSVFAASSLTEAFEDLERGFAKAHPGVDVELTFAGSQVIRLQLEQGAQTDVFAAADSAHMDPLVAEGLVDGARTFAENELAVIVPRRSSGAIASFAELPRAQRLVIGTKEVPVGIYTRKMFDNAKAEFGADFTREVEAHVVSEETNVRLVRAKVELGEADAAVVYRTDALASDRVVTVPIPSNLNVRASYPIGVLHRARHPELARTFVGYVVSAEGKATLRRHGFLVEPG